MSFSILETTRRLLLPRHEISCSAPLWRRLLVALRKRGHGQHESGAFLLGREDESGRRIVDFLLYDDLDPNSLSSGIVHLDGRHFGHLWDLCRERELTVVADVHTHPWGAGQSASDRSHPIIARQGHIALIVPRFARAPVSREEVGVYRYQGSGRWETVPRHMRRGFFHVGI
jgi:hypothetical protein